MTKRNTANPVRVVSPIMEEQEIQCGGVIFLGVTVIFGKA